MRCSVVILLAVSVAVVGGSLLDILTQIHSSTAFQHLSHPEQIIVIELTTETREGEVHDYIDKIGFAKVLSVIDNLPSHEAHMLTQALLKELNIEEHHLTSNATVVPVGKRNLVDLLNTVVNSDSYKHLSTADQNTLKEILTAAENNTLTALVARLGYSTVLTLLDDLSDHDAHRLTNYLTQITLILLVHNA